MLASRQTQQVVKRNASHVALVTLPLVLAALHAPLVGLAPTPAVTIPSASSVTLGSFLTRSLESVRFAQWVLTLKQAKVVSVRLAQAALTLTNRGKVNAAYVVMDKKRAAIGKVASSARQESPRSQATLVLHVSLATTLAEESQAALHASLVGILRKLVQRTSVNRATLASTRIK